MEEICSAVFLYAAQYFKKFWHEGLWSKLHETRANQYVKLLKSYSKKNKGISTQNLMKLKRESLHYASQTSMTSLKCKKQI